MDNYITLAKRLLESHKNPIRKFELPGTKLFIPSKTDEEAELVKKGLNIIKYVFEQERVERRCARATANWLPDQKLAQITKGSKILRTYGFANKDGKFLYPEEAMFLLEVNRLELFLDQVPLSILEAYNTLVSSKSELYKYQAYKKLTLQGFHLVRSDHVTKSNKQQGSPPLKKPRLENEHLKTATSAENNKSSTDLDESRLQPATLPNPQSLEMINDIFDKLQKNSPKKYSESAVVEPFDYKIFSPDIANKTGHHFNLRISESTHFDPKLGFVSSNFPTIVNFPGSEFSGYFQVAQVNLPTLL